MSAEMLRQAMGLHQQGKLEEAGRLYLTLLDQPDDFEPRYLLAALRYQQGRAGEALRLIETALARNPASAKALALHAVLLQTTGNSAAALLRFTEAAARDPNNAEVWYNRGAVLADLARHEEAVTSLDRALALAPSFVAAWNDRGVALLVLKRFAPALESYDRAVALQPNYAQGWYNRGEALQGLKRYDDAIASYDRALACAPGYVAAQIQRAVALQSLYRLDAALAGADAALALQPDLPAALFTRARILCEMDRVAEAHQLLRRRAETLYAGQTLRLPSDPPHKQRHDAEQLDHLKQQGVDAEHGVHFAGGERLNGPAINPHNRISAEQAWREKQPSIVVIDDLLTPQALEGLRRFCQGSTVWRRSYENGYLGAMGENGFACPLLAQIADELRSAFPGIFAEHKLRMMWGFKCDSSLKGLAVHADQAAVNVNFWITPDDANRDPDHGGLVVWDACAPAEWDFDLYNGDTKAVRAFLAQAGARPVTVPYRANRAVIFDSDLFHQTDVINFADGYLNRRTNITMLYGRRQADGS